MDSFVPVQQPDPSNIRDLTAAQRKAMADGGDLTQVVNAYRGGSLNSLTTTAGRSPIKGARLTPEGIYRVSSTREEAIQRLRDNGYLK